MPVVLPDELRPFTKTDEPLAPLTWFRLGGPARYLARPRTLDELVAVRSWAAAQGLLVRLLAGGSDVLVREAGVEGLVIHLESPAFAEVRATDSGIVAGAAVPLTALCSQAARAGFGGLEDFTGIPGTVGGALCSGAGARGAMIVAGLRRATLLDATGVPRPLDRDELDIEETGLIPAGQTLISAEFSLRRDDPEGVVRRMRRVWILKKEHQPYGHQSSGYVFRDPSPETPADMLIDQAKLRGERAGNVEVSERNANFIVAHPGATASDVLRLIEHVRARVRQEFGVELALHLQVW